MGVWGPDVMGSDAAIEFAMDLLTAAGIGPKHVQSLLALGDVLCRVW